MTVVNAQEIVAQSIPKGRFHEGTLYTSSAPFPGTNLQINADGTYQAWGGTATIRDEINLLREDVFNGATSATQYTAGTHCFMYIPGPGDLCYVLCKNTTGTSQVFTVGELLALDSSSGKFVPQTSTNVPYFKVVTATTDANSTADQLVLARRI